MGKTRPTSIETVATEWTDIVMVCRKCGDDGYGPDGEDGLRRVLKKSLREAGLRRRVAVIEVDCFGICPKRAVTTALASRPGRLLVIPHHEPAETVLERLGIGVPARDPVAAAPERAG